MQLAKNEKQNEQRSSFNSIFGRRNNPELKLQRRDRAISSRNRSFRFQNPGSARRKYRKAEKENSSNRITIVL